MKQSTHKLTHQQARKLVLLSQHLPPQKIQGRAVDLTLATIEHLGYVQIDTISVIQRAHHHTLWNRNPKYKLSHIDDLMANKSIFEYWSHAAAYLPMKDYRYSLPRKHAIKSGIENHWYERKTHLMNEILKRIDSEGPLMAKDFESKGKNNGDWQTKPTKQALENLFIEGELMVHSRKNFHKVYDLTEKVLPVNINKSVPTDEEYARFLITRYLQANGLGQLPEIIYLLKNVKAQVEIALKEMLKAEELVKVQVENKEYYSLASSLELLNKKLNSTQLKILSPFDNLLIQRKRTKELFGFDYLLECYVPQAKRKFGYFVLPILWKGSLQARMDCKADRKTGVLHIYNLVLEPSLKKIDAFALALNKELEVFMQFNNCHKIQLHKVSPVNFK